MPRKDIFQDELWPQRQLGQSGRSYWRSLGELAETEEFRQRLAREFPTDAWQWPDASSRRQFLTIMGASLALAGLGGCSRQPEEKILPYVRMPEDIVPGQPLFYATAMPFAGYGVGVVVESHMGRPTKIEGNGLHPASRGHTNQFAQASVLTLYDPDRSQAISHRGVLADESAFRDQLTPWLDDLQMRGGRGLHVLTETVTSPTLAGQLARLKERFPDFVWHQYEPVANDSEMAGAQLALGEPVQAVHDLEQADVVLALDADFLDTRSWPLSYALDFMQNRRLTNAGDLANAEDLGHAGMNRLYVCQSTPTLTGSKADHQLTLPPREVAAVVHHIAAELGIAVSGDVPLPRHISPAWIQQVVADLRNYRRRGEGRGSLVLAGKSLSKETHALVHAMNAKLGNVGTTIRYVSPVAAEPRAHVASLSQLVKAMDAGEVDVLVILGANPVFTAPADLAFRKALAKVSLSVHCGLYEDETARACEWHLPATHYLEQWSDTRAFDGTASIIQPLIQPLYGGWSPHAVVAALSGDWSRSGHELVRSYWRGRRETGDFEAAWEEWLKRGTIPETGAVEVQPELRSSEVLAAWSNFVSETNGAHNEENRYTVLFRPDPSVWDGRFANNGWLQELPKPFSKLTWDNAAWVSPATAEKLAVTGGDVVRLTDGAREIRVPVWPVPGQPDNCITLYFGYGRRDVGHVGQGTGVDVYPLRRSDAPWSTTVEVHKTEEHQQLATTQEHFGMQGRHPIQHGTLDLLQQAPHQPSFMHAPQGPADASLLQYEWEYDTYKWGMAIDLTACVGCNACTIACQAENNIPVVGKEQVMMGREMHWIRVDTYHQGAPEHPATFHQPVPCMHCEKAPCELVCPVAATTHSEEGLNEMTYNRCVGTRYCSNNCPYKVRRFNFLQYTDYDASSLALLNNPDVTVRSRGVMEKCTYCVQRINKARIEADKLDSRIGPTDLETACQAACPTRAIAFGDMNNADWPVNRWKQNPLNYALLEELNTRPRTTYLAEIRNPNKTLDNQTNGRRH